MVLWLSPPNKKDLSMTDKKVVIESVSEQKYMPATVVRPIEQNELSTSKNSESDNKSKD